MDENSRKRKFSSTSINSVENIMDCVVIESDTSEEPSEKHAKITDISNPNHNLDLQLISDTTTDVFVIKIDDKAMEESLSQTNSQIFDSQQSSGYYSQQTVDSIESSEELLVKKIEDCEPGEFVVLDEVDETINESQEIIEIVDDKIVEIDLSKSQDSIKDANVTVINSVDELNLEKELKHNEKSITNADVVDISSDCELLLNDSLTMNEKNAENNQLHLEDGEVDDDKSIFNNCIQITFSDKTVADIYKSTFVKFLENFIEFDVKAENELSINISRDPELKSSDWIALENAINLNESTDDSPTKKRKRKKKKDLFILDTNPSLSSSKHSSATKYNTKFFIEDLPKTDEMNDKKVQKSAQTCFNCDKNHALKDCPEEKDFKKINAARQLFKTQSKPTRYHVEENHKYADFKPGHISNQLRYALGLDSHQLPPYIYNMRLLGYPPGWLEEAKVEDSNLTLFDIDGKSLKSTTKPKYGLDPDKIIDYYGFNVPPPRGFVDEHLHYDTPPYLTQFRKEAMIEFYNKQFLREQDNLETCDMDLDGDEELQSQTVEKVEENQEKNDKKMDESNPESLSLIELEKQKENLLAALDDNSNVNILDEESSSNTQDSIVCGTPLKEPSVKQNDSVTPSADKERLSIVKTSSFGTPVLKSSSPYQSLPNPVNFSKNVSPVINFENLPNTTGKYKQLTNVLEKVRTTLKSLQNFKS